MEGVQLQVGSRGREWRSLQWEGGSTALSREQEEGVEVTAGAGGSASSRREQGEGVEVTAVGGREHSFK